MVVQAKPPSPFFQKLNAALHQEPVATIAHSAFWSIVVCLSCPLVVVVLTCRMMYRVLLWALWPGTTDAFDPKVHSQVEMAVAITGCDTGFGKELALWAADAGYIVFAGCLHPDQSWPASSVTSGTVRPVLMDVTNDGHVAAVVTTIKSWLQEKETNASSEEKQKTRVLHCLINNAGVGVGSIVDWTDLSFYQRCIDVNYLGMIRVCKAFLPLFKEQAVNRIHTSGMRIFNMTSMAGLVSSGLAGFSAYAGAKHAANSFSSVLRSEVKGFGIQVTTINPSFHGTPLVESMGDVLTQSWQRIDEKQRNEYGQVYFNRLKFLTVDIPRMAMWDAKMVVDEIMKCLKMRESPFDLLIGSDARFALPFLRMLPSWCLDLLLIVISPATPAAMENV